MEVVCIQAVHFWLCVDGNNTFPSHLIVAQAEFVATDSRHLPKGTTQAIQLQESSVYDSMETAESGHHVEDGETKLLLRKQHPQ